MWIFVRLMSHTVEAFCQCKHVMHYASVIHSELHNARLKVTNTWTFNKFSQNPSRTIALVVTHWKCWFAFALLGVFVRVVERNSSVQFVNKSLFLVKPFREISRSGINLVWLNFSQMFSSSFQVHSTVVEMEK